VSIPPVIMPRDCWASLKSSCQHVTADFTLSRWALVYLPTICVVSVFVALTWLGLSMNNLTFRDKDLLVVITYFAALLVLECILLVHVAIRHQRTAMTLQNPPCIESVLPTFSNNSKDDVESPRPASHTVENLGQPTPQVHQPSPAKVIKGSPQEPESHNHNIKPFATSSHEPSLSQFQRVPALCQPYHPSTMPEITRPPTAAAHMPQSPSLPIPEAATDLRSSWDLTMATNHQSLAAQPPTSSTPPAELLQAETHIQPLTELPSSGKSTIRLERQATPGIPEIKSLKLNNHTSAFPPSVPHRHGSHEMHRISADGRARQQQQPQLKSQSPASQHVQPHSHSHNSLLQKNLVALAGT
jgi:hypothetical protein